MPATTKENILYRLFEYLYKEYYTKKNEEALRKWGVFFKLVILSDENKEGAHYNDETAAEQIATNKTLIDDYLKSHARGDFAAFLKIIAELNVNEFMVAYQKLLTNIDYQRVHHLLALKVHVINDDYASAKHLLEKYPGVWAETRDNKKTHEEVRLLRKALLNKNPQMLALLLKYNIPDKKDVHGITAKQLAHLYHVHSSEISSMFMFGNRPSFLNFFKLLDCRDAFEFAKKDKNIKTYPVLFMIANYFSMVGHTFNHSDTYFFSSKPPASAVKDTEKKLTYFFEMLQIIALNKHPQEKIREYLNNKFKDKKPGTSAFRDVTKELIYWNDEELKESFKALYTHLQQKPYPENFTWDEHGVALFESIRQLARLGAEKKDESDISMKSGPG